MTSLPRRRWIASTALLLLATAALAQDWRWGPNTPKAPDNLSSRHTERLLLGLAGPAESKDSPILFGGLVPESGRFEIGSSRTEWWLWCGVEPDGTIAALAISDREPSRKASESSSFVRVDAGALVEMPVFARKDAAAAKRRKIRVITHVLDAAGVWQEIDHNRTRDLSKQDPEGFRRAVLDLLDLD